VPVYASVAEAYAQSKRQPSAAAPFDDDEPSPQEADFAPQKPKSSMGTHAVILAALLGMLAGVVIVGAIVVRKLEKQRAPRFRVLDADGSEDCTSLLDYCLRTTCTVANHGQTAGTASVVLEVISSRGRSFQAVETVFLPAGDSRVVSHDFSEVGLFDNASHRATCRIMGNP
jgi:hypothetical protein